MTKYLLVGAAMLIGLMAADYLAPGVVPETACFTIIMPEKK